MNIIREGDYNTLLRKLCAAANKSDLPKTVAAECESLLREISWGLAVSIVKEICSREHVSSNLYGVLNNTIEDRLRVEQDKVYTREDWKAQEGCCTDNEFSYFMAIMTLITKAHTSGRVQSNSNGITKPLTIDEYKNSGFPKTWSLIVDHFLDGYYKFYCMDLSQPGALENFLMRYLDTLKKKLEQNT